MPSIEIDLSDYEDDIVNGYCYGNCLLNQHSDLKSDIEDYVEEMYKNIYIYSESNRKIKTMQEIYDDLERILKEYK